MTRNALRGGLALLAFALPRPTPAEPPPVPTTVTNARTESRVLAGPLAETVRREGAGPSWIGYAVASAQRGQMCCFDSWPRKGPWPRGACCLEKGRKGTTSCSTGGRGTGPERAASPEAHVLLRVASGRVDQVGVYSPDCLLDASGLRVLWLAAVPSAESVALLESVAAARTSDSDLPDEALMAIATHADPKADAALQRLAAPGGARETREQAAFWLGESRGRAGYEALRRLQRDDDADFREHLTFAFSESPVPEATDTLLEMARTDRDREVRGQALFWLAQKAGQKAKAAITRAIAEDPDTEVKKKAVFALSEMDDGVPLLIQVAETNKNPAVREQAFFWLGQSEDPKALEFLAQVLERP